MNLSWKNRFLESRDVVISQFRELAVILDEFSRQIDGAKNITEEYKGAIKKAFRRYHILIDNMLLLEYDSGRRELYLTAKTTNGRCVTSKDAAELLEDVFEDTTWLPAKDSRSIITRKFETVRFEEKGDYYLTWGAAGVPKQGERYSGDNYSFCERGSSQVMFSLCDGMGCGAEASRESRRIVELLEVLLETGFAPRSAFKQAGTSILLPVMQAGWICLQVLWKYVSWGHLQPLWSVRRVCRSWKRDRFRPEHWDRRSRCYCPGNCGTGTGCLW